MNLDWNKNEESGNLEANFNATLKSVSDTIFEFDNENKTKYRIATVQLETGKNISGIMYEKNYQHGVELGNSQMCRASYDETREDDSIFITVSHLVVGDRATAADLGLDLAQVKSMAKADAKEQFAS